LFFEYLRTIHSLLLLLFSLSTTTRYPRRLPLRQPHREPLKEALQSPVLEAVFISILSTNTPLLSFNDEKKKHYNLPIRGRLRILGILGILGTLGN
jgi:hypothetical protein